MEDIIDIYDPIFRETNNILLILIISFIIILISFIIFFVIKKIKSKKIFITPEQQYKKTLDKYLDLQSKMNTLDTTSYSSTVTFLFKEYLTELLNFDFLSATNQEMLLKLKLLTTKDDEILADYFMNKLEPAQFGKYEIDEKEKNIIIKNCVDTITNLYTETIGEQND